MPSNNLIKSLTGNLFENHWDTLLGLVSYPEYRSFYKKYKGHCNWWTFFTFNNHEIILAQEVCLKQYTKLILFVNWNKLWFTSFHFNLIFVLIYLANNAHQALDWNWYINFALILFLHLFSSLLINWYYFPMSWTENDSIILFSFCSYMFLALPYWFPIIWYNHSLKYWWLIVYMI